MSKWLIVSGLACLNLMLGVGVYQRVLEKPASAQIGGGTRPDVVAAVGAAAGQTAVYLLDATSGRLIALKLDVTNKMMTQAAVTNVADALNRVR